ncbi:GNAT family N-acetyltransferase [Chryseobacterium sp.]|uniref:GNAT family N-acetyltransferase n=1 Tax=Chryseobacterium sp. TaxID=1871047 RepID=UPI0023F98A7A|nr:GNAT family N-acetyltransferase [Chryseobacterium sp.]
MKVKVQLLNKSHNKSGFECGKPLLDNYIRTQASQDVKRDLSACYVMTEDESNLVLGYYTLSGNSIERLSFPEDMIVKLPPSYSDLPTILLGRLALDKKMHGKKLGEYLLINALNKCVEVSQTIGAIAVVVVDPIDKQAEDFYSSYGFIFLPGSKKMFISIKTIEDSN